MYPDCSEEWRSHCGRVWTLTLSLYDFGLKLCQVRQIWCFLHSSDKSVKECVHRVWRLPQIYRLGYSSPSVAAMAQMWKEICHVHTCVGWIFKLEIQLLSVAWDFCSSFIAVTSDEWLHSLHGLRNWQKKHTKKTTNLWCKRAKNWRLKVLWMNGSKKCWRRNRPHWLPATTARDVTDILKMVL